MAELRSLQIKTGTVKRLGKELVMYKQEETKERQKVAKMKEEDADAHDIKFAENILAESTAMVPDTQQRLKAAVKDLEEFLEENKEVLGDASECQAAQEEATKALAILEA